MNKHTFSASLLFLFSFFPFVINAQERDFEKEFENFHNQVEREYQSFNDKINQEFGEFLKQIWEEFPQEQPKKVEKRPEPIEPVVYQPIEKEIEPVEITPAGIIIPITIIKELPVFPVKIPETKPISRTAIAFYDTNVEVAANFASNLKLESIQEKDVSRAWEQICKQEYIQFIQDCLQIRDDMQLSDWAYADFAKQVAYTLYPEEQPNERAFLQMFILLQSGYKVKIAKIGEQLTLMYATANPVYEAPYITIDDVHYYICEPLGNRANKDVFTYRSEFANAKNLIDLNIHNPMQLDIDSYEKIFTSKDNAVTIESEVNKNLIDFYNNYPRCDVAIYAKAPISKELANSILPTLRENILNKSNYEAISFLLHFVQTAFDYKTDGDQFGYEKPFFIDELFFYPYCDCEDRSILFAYLVKELTGQDAVLLNYPKHIATAIYFNEEVNGDHLFIGDKKYIICDPTFIGAPIGACMPEYKQTSPKIIK